MKKTTWHSGMVAANTKRAAVRQARRAAVMEDRTGIDTWARSTQSGFTVTLGRNGRVSVEWWDGRPRFER